MPNGDFVDKIENFDFMTTCFYKIQEKSKGEWWSLDGLSPKRVVRWCDKGSDDQKYLLIPVENGYVVNIMPKVGEYISVGGDGHFVKWEYKGDDTQKFKIHPNQNSNYDSTHFEIQEFTNNEYAAIAYEVTVAVVRRWEYEDDKEWKFRFMVTDEVVRPTLESLNNDLPLPPPLTDTVTEPPGRTDPVKIGHVIVPAVFVQDSRYGNDRVWQVKECPYYRLERWQYWICENPYGYYRYFDGGSNLGDTVTVTEGLSEEQSKTITETLGVTVAAEASWNFGKGSGGFSGSVTHELQVSETTSNSRWLETTVTVTVKAPAGKQYAEVRWAKASNYKLFRHDDNYLLYEWTEVDQSRSRTDAYPDT